MSSSFPCLPSNLADHGYSPASCSYLSANPRLALPPMSSSTSKDVSCYMPSKSDLRGLLALYGVSPRNTAQYLRL